MTLESHAPYRRPLAVALTLAALALGSGLAPERLAAAPTPPPEPAAAPAAETTSDAPETMASETALLAHTLERDGIAIDVEMKPLAAGADATDRFLEGDTVEVTFRITDTATGQALSSLYPAAWLDLLPSSGSGANREVLTAGKETCRNKVESFIGGTLLAQPALDLNVYYVLALNADPSISVVDPLFGFGGSKLLDLVRLESPGEDWQLTADQRRLYVSMPAAGKVAVVDTAHWEVTETVPVGPGAAALLLQPDERYLWVAWEGGDEREPSGVSAIDTESLEVVARIETGRGRHELAASPEDRYLYVSNSADGTVSVVDVARLEKVADVAVGERPVSMAYSVVGRSLWLAHADGVITVVGGGDEPRVTARIEADPGLSLLRFAPDGRLGFAVSPEADTIHILDAAVPRILQTGDMEDEPYELAFSDELVYVAHRGSDIILMIPFDQIGVEGAPVPAIDFPGGQSPPGVMEDPSRAPMIVQAPGSTAVLLANPGDQAIYFYKEGMAAPMGHFKNYGRTPRAVEVVDRSLREQEPGVYRTTAQLPAGGLYDLALFVDSPRVVECVGLEVADRVTTPEDPVVVRFEAPPPGELVAGREVELGIRVSDHGEPLDGLHDVRVLTFLAPGTHQRRTLAEPAGDGLYRVRFTPSEAGVYYVFVEIASEGFPFNRSPAVILEVTDPSAAGASRETESVQEVSK